MMLRVIVVAWTIHTVMGATTYKLLGSEAHFTEHMANVSATWTAISTADLKQYANIHINNNKQLLVNSRSERNELHRAGSFCLLTFLAAWYLTRLMPTKRFNWKTPYNTFINSLKILVTCVPDSFTVSRCFVVSSNTSNFAFSSLSVLKMRGYIRMVLTRFYSAQLSLGFCLHTNDMRINL